MPDQTDNPTRRTDLVWIGSIASLVGVVIIAIITFVWSTQHGGAPASAHHPSAGEQAHPHPAAQPSHNDFFTNHGRYMPRTHCLLNEAGQPDWPWIAQLIGLSLVIIAAYARIYLFWCKSYFREEPRDRNPRLMDLAQIFLWCAVTGYAASVLMFFWPAYRLVAVCLLFLAFWSWRFCLNLSGFSAAFSADRYKRLAEHDPLTGLLGRFSIANLIGDRLERRKQGVGRPLAVLFLDFDRFKLVNDAMGHDAGDQLLRQVADRLRDTAGQIEADDGVQCHIGRLGGDEFAILIEAADNPDATDKHANTFLQALTCAYRLDERTIHSSVSIGIATTDHDYRNADDMLRDADTAMYEAKRAGRARTVWFSTQMHQAVRDAIELENDLRHAIERDELFLVYQPIIDLEDGAVTGFEALLRWRHPKRGLVGPDQFIPIAEESLLIRPIGRWVLDQALAQLKTWRQRFPELKDAVMNVNLSRVQFADPSLTQFIIHCVQRHGLPYDALCLEITESTIMQDNQAAVKLLHHFREQGIRLAMDDFGTGYSSLSHLHEFPLDALKIDRAFIANLSSNRDYAAVVNAITALAGNLGFSVVAEGVETVEQIAELQALACHKAQGYYFHKPAEPPVIEAYLSDREQRGRAGAQTA